MAWRGGLAALAAPLWGLLALGVHEGLVLLYSALPPACTSPLATAGRVFQLRTVLAVLTTPTNNMAALLAGPYWDMAYKILGEFPPEIAKPAQHPFHPHPLLP